MHARPLHHYVLLFMSAISVAVFVICLYLFMYVQIHSLVARSLAVADVVSSRKFDRAHASEVKRVFDATASERASIKSLYVPSDNLIQFIESMESISSSTGASVSVASIQADDLGTADAGTIGTIQARVEARGSWTAVMKSLALIENGPYIVAIDSAKLYSSRQMTGSAISAGGSVERVTWSLSVDLKALSVAVPRPNNNQ